MGHSPNQILMETLQAPIAFVFPGQGSQSLGMLSEWGNTPIVRQIFDESSEALGYNVWELAQNGPEDKLNQTEYTQPALLTASVAIYQLWQSMRQERPILLAGHSLGEYSALVCAGALSLAEGVRLVAERGRLMQLAVPKGVGAMAAIIGLSDKEVVLACEQAMADKATKAKEDKVANADNIDKAGAGESEASWIVAPANFNSPQQVVIAGTAEAVAKAMDCAKALGAKRVIPLTVSVPSHCALMETAAENLAQTLSTSAFRMPSIPVLHNVDVVTQTTVSGLRQALVSQLYSPVRWVECMQKMAAEGIKSIVECGPGSVLTGLNKRIVPELHCVSAIGLMA